MTSSDLPEQIALICADTSKSNRTQMKEIVALVIAGIDELEKLKIDLRNAGNVDRARARNAAIDDCIDSLKAKLGGTSG